MAPCTPATAVLNCLRLYRWTRYWVFFSAVAANASEELMDAVHFSAGLQSGKLFAALWAFTKFPLCVTKLMILFEQGVVLGVIYLIVAAAVISTTVKMQQGTTDFGVSFNGTTISGMQDCNSSGAVSLAIIGIIAAFIGSGIYVRFVRCFSFSHPSNSLWCFFPFHREGFRRMGQHYEESSTHINFLSSSQWVLNSNVF